MTPVVGTASVELLGDDSQFQRAMDSAADRFRSVGQTMTRVGARFTAAVTLPLAGIGAAATKLAVDAEEAGNKFEVVMGGAAEAVRARLQGLTATIPLTTAEMEGLAAGLQDMLVPMGVVREQAAGISVDMVALAGDLASFNNVPTARVLEAIQSALAGSSEPMRRFGVDTRVARLEALALEAGLIKAGEELDNATTALAVLAAIQRDSTDAMGDAARTVDSTANAMRFLGRDIRQLGIEIGEALIPVVTPLIARARELVAWFSELSPRTQQVILVVAGLAAAIGPLLLALGLVVSGVGAVSAALASPLLVPIAAAVAAIAGLVAAWVAFGDDVTKVMKAVVKVAKTNIGKVVDVLGTFFKPLTDVAKAWFRMQKEISGFMGDLVVFVVKQAAELMEGVWEFLVERLRPIGDAVARVFRPVIEFFELMDRTVTRIVRETMDAIWEIMTGSLRRIADGVRAGLDRVTGFFADMRQTLVGGSIVPEMVDAIAKEFGRMGSEMGSMSTLATDSVRSAFQGLGSALPGTVGKIVGEIGKITDAVAPEVFAMPIKTALDAVLSFFKQLADELPAIIDTLLDLASKLVGGFSFTQGDTRLELGGQPPSGQPGGTGTTVSVDPGGIELASVIFELQDLTRIGEAHTTHFEGIGRTLGSMLETLKLSGRLLWAISNNTRFLVPSVGAAAMVGTMPAAVGVGGTGARMITFNGPLIGNVTVSDVRAGERLGEDLFREIDRRLGLELSRADERRGLTDL